MPGALTNKALSAAGKGDLATLKALRDQIDLNKSVDKFGATPVHYSARAGKVDCIRWLVQTAGLSGNKPANNGATPAHDAAATGQLDCLQWLVQLGGCSPTVRDSCGATPLHLASRFGHLPVVVWLVENEGCSATDKAQNGVTPVHLAAAKGSINCLRWLTQNDPTCVNKRADNGTTPVYFAAQEGRLECLKFLIAQVDGNYRLRANDGMAPVHAAAQMGQLECLQWLIESVGVSPMERDNDGATPVHFAAARGHIPVLQWLLKHGAKVERDDLGGTALHDAAEHGQKEALEVLLSTGADHTVQDLDGLTAADLAEECGHMFCADFIRGYEPPPLPDLMLSGSNARPNSDDFESISSTNLTIKPTLASPHSQSHKSITKTISPSHTKQQLNIPQSRVGREQDKRDRKNSAASARRQERGKVQQRSLDGTEKSERDELKHVFAKLQNKSVAQKLQQHLEEEETESVKPVKDNRGEDDDSLEGSTASLKNLPTQDRELLKEVRAFESEELKSAPQHRKNLNPIKLGHIIEEPDSAGKETTSQQKSQSTSVRSQPPAEHDMAEVEEGEAEGGTPLWKRALMKKRAAEQKQKGPQMEMKAKEENRKWKNVPAWKRAVLEKRDAQREEEEMKENEITVKEMEKQAIFDALPSWKKRLILEKRS